MKKCRELHLMALSLPLSTEFVQVASGVKIVYRLSRALPSMSSG